MDNNLQVAKRLMADIQAVVTEASYRLDKLVPEELTVESACSQLLRTYLGREPSAGEVLTFKTSVELTLHNDYGVSTSKF